MSNNYILDCSIYICSAMCTADSNFKCQYHWHQAQQRIRNNPCVRGVLRVVLEVGQAVTVSHVGWIIMHYHDVLALRAVTFKVNCHRRPNYDDRALGLILLFLRLCEDTLHTLSDLNICLLTFQIWSLYASRQPQKWLYMSCLICLNIIDILDGEECDIGKIISDSPSPHPI